jgi:hypothetical protein
MALYVDVIFLAVCQLSELQGLLPLPTQLRSLVQHVLLLLPLLLL